MDNIKQAHLIYRDKYPLCYYNRLTSLDIEVLIKETAGNKCLVKALALASLCIGRSVTDICSNVDQIKLSQKNNCGIMLTGVNHPTFKNLGDFIPLQFIANESRSFAMLHYDVAEIILRSGIQEYQIDRLCKDVKNFLQTINRKFGTKLTPARITMHLTANAFLYGLSKAEVTWLTSAKLSNGASHYLQADSISLRDKLFAYINDLYMEANLSPGFVSEPPQGNKKKIIGSNYNSRNEQIRRKNNELVDRIEQLRSSVDLDVVSFHNHYTFFVLQLLNLATGHRPGEGQYNTLDCFDLLNGCVYIQDKLSRGTGTSRRIPLSNMAIQQIQHYLEHLNSLQKLCLYNNDSIADDVQASLDSKKPLFRFIRKGALIAVTSAQYSQFVSIADKNKSNWNRHWLRTNLYEQYSILDSAVNNYMGHEDELNETTSRFSNLSRDNIDTIALFLEEAMESLGFKPIAGISETNGGEDQ